MPHDLSKDSVASIRRRMQGHLAAANDELRGVGEALRRELQPATLIRKHPAVVALLVGMAGTMVWRCVARGKPVAAAPAAPAVPSPGFGKRLATNALSYGGRLLCSGLMGAASKFAFGFRRRP